MKNTDIFDVLVVYSHKIARSASTIINEPLLPFSPVSDQSIYNTVYGFFIEECKKNNITAALTTSADITGAGKCRSYWLFENNTWIPVQRKCFSQHIFDKFAPINTVQKFNREKLFSSSNIVPFSNSFLYELFSDKQKTYDFLSEYSIPTVSIQNNTLEDVCAAIDQLHELISTHPHKQDFSKSIILKDKYGSGGMSVFKIDQDYSSKIYKILAANKDKSFVIQPFVYFNSGYNYKNYRNFTEIRIIYLGNRIVQTYIRVAQNDSFLCNDGNGEILITNKDIPSNVLKVSQSIVKKLNRKNALYTLDFIVSNSKNVYILEGNINPGIDWHPELPENIKLKKQLIRIIIRELSKRVHNSHNTSGTLTKDTTITIPPSKEILLPHV